MLSSVLFLQREDCSFFPRLVEKSNFKISERSVVTWMCVCTEVCHFPTTLKISRPNPLSTNHTPPFHAHPDHHQIKSKQPRNTSATRFTSNTSPSPQTTITTPSPHIYPVQCATLIMGTALPRRILKETERLMADPPPGISGAPANDNLRYFAVNINGPESSPYEGLQIPYTTLCFRGDAECVV